MKNDQLAKSPVSADVNMNGEVYSIDRALMTASCANGNNAKSCWEYGSREISFDDLPPY